MANKYQPTGVQQRAYIPMGPAIALTAWSSLLTGVNTQAVGELGNIADEWLRGSPPEGGCRLSAAPHTKYWTRSGPRSVCRLLAQGRGGLQQRDRYDDEANDRHDEQDGGRGAICDRGSKYKAVLPGSSLGRSSFLGGDAHVPQCEHTVGVFDSGRS